MRRSIFAVGAAATMAVALAIPSALQAHDTKPQRDGGGSMMGPGMMNGNGQMGQMMDHCNQMMGGNSGRPNEQWRDDGPPAGGKNGKKQ